MATRSLFTFFLCLFFFLSEPHGLRAATSTWIGPAGGSWSTASYWSANSVPTSSTTVVIGAGDSPTLFSTGQTAQSITAQGTSTTPSYINTDSSSYVFNLNKPLGGGSITGGYLYFGSGFNLSLAAAQTWAATQISFTSSASQPTLALGSYKLTIAQVSGGSATVNVDLQSANTLVTGTGSLSVGSGGTLAIGGAVNTFSGGINVASGGTLDLNDGTASKGLGSGQLALRDGSSMTFGSSSNIQNSYTLGGAIQMAGSTATNPFPTFSGTGTLLSSSTLNLSPTMLSGIAMTGNLIDTSGTPSLTVNNLDSSSGWVTLQLSGQNTFLSLTANTGVEIVVDADTTTSSGGTTGPVGTGTLTLNGADLSAYASTSHSIANSINLLGGSNSSVGQASSAGATLNLSGGISGYSLTKLGPSTLIFSGSLSNSFTGGLIIEGGEVIFNKSKQINGTNAVGSGTGSSITINSNSLLSLGEINQIPSGVTMILNGGTFNTAGLAVVASNASLGTLTLSADSYIELGSGSTILKYASVLGTSWTSGATLYITGWNGNLTGGGSTQLIFGSNAGDISSAQLSQIRFINPSGLPNGFYSATITGIGEVVPGSFVVPEPSTLCMGGLLSVFGLYYIIRRRKAPSLN